MWSGASLLGLVAVVGDPGATESIHLLESRAHRADPSILELRSLGATRDAPTAQRFNKTVYGYFPYWATDSASIPWQHLTHLSFFAVELQPDGSLGNAHGWDGAGGAELVALGHTAGVKVTLTATLFDSAGIETLLLDPTARAAAQQNLLGMVMGQGGDGINIDFEVVPFSVKQQFVDFMAALTTAFHTAIPGSHVSLASPAVDWGGAYDYDLLAINTDGLLIMGYDYHWPGGPPGPVSPLTSGTTWSGRDLSWTINDYLYFGGAANRQKFVLGFPLYGVDWPTTDAAVPGTATASGVSVRASACETQFVSGKSWDSASQTPYQVYSVSAGWRQLFCEDEASLAAKLDLEVADDLGGVMFWALSYVPADHPLWAQVDAHLLAGPAEADEPIPVNEPPPASCACADAVPAWWLLALALRLKARGRVRPARVAPACSRPGPCRRGAR